MCLLRIFSCDPNSENIPAIQAGDTWGRNSFQNRPKAAVAEEEEAQEGASSRETPRGMEEEEG